MKIWHLILLGIGIIASAYLGFNLALQTPAVDEGGAPVQEGAARVEEGATGGGEGRTATEESGILAGEGGSNSEEGGAPVQGGAAAAEEGAESTYEGATPAQEGAAAEGGTPAQENTAVAQAESEPPHSPSRRVELAEPRYDSSFSVEKAMRGRRSIRSYSDAPLTLAEVSQLLWAAQGITNDRGFRTAPSAGALYPLEVYVVAGKVDGLAAGIYKYRPREHELWRVDLGDKRRELSEAALGQEPVADGAIDIVFAAVYGRTAVKYGERATRYVHMEIGHAAQNVFLQAGALDLGAAVIGAFFDEEVEKVVQMERDERALYIMPVGRKVRE